MTLSQHADQQKGTNVDKMSTPSIPLSQYNPLTDTLLQSVLGKEAPNECIVQGQNISEIGPLSENYSSVRRLDISFNALKHFSGIDQFPRLRELSAYCCRLDDVTCLGDTTHLVSLLLQQNGIASFPTSFKTLKNLRELRVDRNQITSIENLSGCSALRILDLSFNNIESLSGIAGLQSLQELKVNNNKITSLQTLRSLPSIRELQVSHNKLVNLDGVQYLPTLETIHADNNVITTVKVPQTFMKRKNVSASSSREVSSSSSTSKLQKGSVLVSASAKNLPSTSASSSAINRQDSGRDSSTTTLGHLALTDLYLSHNQISSLDGLNSLGTKIEVMDIEFNCMDLSREKTESLAAVMSTLKQLNELKINKAGYGGNSKVLNAALFASCSSLTIIDGQSATGEVRVEDLREAVLTYEKNTNYGSDSDDSDYEDASGPALLKKQASSRRRVSLTGSATAIKEIAQIDDVTILEGNFKKVITNCKETWTAFLKLSSAPEVIFESKLPMRRPIEEKVEPKVGIIASEEEELSSQISRVEISAKIVLERDVATIIPTIPIIAADPTPISTVIPPVGDLPVPVTLPIAIVPLSLVDKINERKKESERENEKAKEREKQREMLLEKEKKEKESEDSKGSFFISQISEDTLDRPLERPAPKLHISTDRNHSFSTLPQPPSSNNSTGELRYNMLITPNFMTFTS